MFHTRKYRYDSILLLNSFYEKISYKTRVRVLKRHNLTNKQFAILMQIYLIGLYTNKLVTINGLAPFVPCNLHRINSFISVLIDKELIKNVPTTYTRKNNKGIKKDMYYALTPEGENVINTFETLLNKELKKFKDKYGNKWRELKGDNLKHFQSLGLIKD